MQQPCSPLVSMMEYLMLPFLPPRSSRYRIVGGVCGGMAQAAGTRPVVVRLLALLLLMTTQWVAVMLYLALWVLMPASHSRG